jgi:hypothetical protein
MGSINLINMRKLQLLGDSVMWLVIAGVLSLGFVILAVVWLLALIRELFVERALEADSTPDEGAAGTADVDGASERRCVMTP